MADITTPHPSVIITQATLADVPNIARVFLAGLETSLPHLKLATKFYDWERDFVAPDGRLRARLEMEQREDHVFIASLPQADGEDHRPNSSRIIGYVVWRNPSVDHGLYQTGEIKYLFVDPIYHGRGAGSTLIRYAQTAAVVQRQELIQTYPEDGVVGDTIMGVMCFALNPAGVRAYERRGFIVRSEKIEPNLNEKAFWMEWNGPL